VDATLVKELVDIYQSLDLYATAFEPALLDATANYYANAGQVLIRQHEDIDAYLLTVASLIGPSYPLQRLTMADGEKSRIESYLQSTSATPILSLMHHHLLAVHLAEILDRYFQTVFCRYEHGEWTRLVQSMQWIDALTALGHAFGLAVKVSPFISFDLIQRRAVWRLWKNTEMMHRR
jgi:hypothetical protein